jgi:curved DNA-binding protein|tara:strand:- start:6240 stop:7028 length:789 start_codon:yes stop_codon:yes gene_type:complete
MDHYKTLGITTAAAPDEIKKAYRKLASQHHPDKGGTTAKFQEIQTAYDTLSDPVKRNEYDNPKPKFGNFGQHPHPNSQHFDFETIFDVFGAKFNNTNRQQHRAISRVNLTISLVDVATGGKRTVSLGGPTTIEIDLPRGINTGDSLHFKGLAPGGGDLVISFRVREDPIWQRHGANLHTEHVVDIWDLIIGAESTIKDLLGQEITIVIPPSTQPGARLRLRGKGLPDRAGTGDIIIQIQAKIPSDIPEDLLNMIKQKRTSTG